MYQGRFTFWNSKIDMEIHHLNDQLVAAGNPQPFPNRKMDCTLQMSIFQPDLIGLSHWFHYNKMHPWFWMEVQLPSLGGVHLRKITSHHLLLFSPGWSNILNDLTPKTPPPPISKNMLLKNWISFPLGNLERKSPTTQPPHPPQPPNPLLSSKLPAFCRSLVRRVGSLQPVVGGSTPWHQHPVPGPTKTKFIFQPLIFRA